MQTSNHKKREVDLSQQIFHNADPFRIDWFSANRLPRPTIPVGCVVLIAFFAMQVEGSIALIASFIENPRQ
jgi:hypothetical protein